MSQNRKWADKNSSKQFLWIKQTWIYWLGIAGTGAWFTIFTTRDAVWFSFWVSVIGQYHSKPEAQTLKTDSHDIIFWSFFLFLNLSIALWPPFSDQWILGNMVLNNIGFHRSNFCTIKVIQSAVNARSYPERTLKTIYWSWFTQRVELTYCNRTSFSWCVIRTPPTPPLTPIRDLGPFGENV